MRVVPALDLLDGNCVRLVQGDYAKVQSYSDDPVNVAKFFQGLGFQRLHIVDLDGAKSGIVSDNHLKILDNIRASTTLTIDYSGGIQSLQDATAIIECGADQIMLGTIAIREKRLTQSILEKHGSETVILAADVKKDIVVIRGWQEKTNVSVNEVISWFTSIGGEKVMVTDVDRDGLLQGTNSELYKKLLEEFPDLILIASGGVANVEDIEKLSRIGVREIIVGKALYEGKISLSEIGSFVW